MFQSGSPYSPFFTAGLQAATENAERSFLSLDSNTVAESSSSRTRSIPSPKPAPSSTLPDVPRRLCRKGTTSTASTGYRKSRRSDALARLEGRTTRIPSSKQSNFISLTDDEDDDDSSSDESDELFNYPFAAQRSSITLVPAAEDNSFILPPTSAPPAPTFRFSMDSFKKPSSKHNKRTRIRSHSVSQWFPLKSFIDLRDREDDSSSVSVQWTAWRSFMEIGSVA